MKTNSMIGKILGVGGLLAALSGCKENADPCYQDAGKFYQVRDTITVPTGDGGFGLGVGIAVDTEMNYQMRWQACLNFENADVARDALVQPTVRMAVRDVIAHYKAADFCSEENIAKIKPEIEEKVDNRIRHYEPGFYGVYIESFVRGIEVPQALLDACEAKRQAGGQ